MPTHGLLPAGVSARQHAQRARWQRTPGQTAAQRSAARLNLVAARVVLARTALVRHRTCRRGHLFTPVTTRIDKRNGARQCTICQTLTARWRAAEKRAARARQQQLQTARAAMIDAGIKAQQQPGSQYWRDRFVAVRDRWRELKGAA